MNSQEKSQRVACYGCIINHQNEVLLVKRASDDSHPGIWELPGGSSDFTEEPKEAAKREVLEETGLSVSVHHPVAVHSSTSTRNMSMQIIRLAFFCTLTDEKQDVVLSREHSEHQWIPYSQARTISPLSDFCQELFNDTHLNYILRISG